jgi:hypothetical protein
LAGGRKLRQRIEKVAVTGAARAAEARSSARPAAADGAKLRFSATEGATRERIGADEPPPVEPADEEPAAARANGRRR